MGGGCMQLALAGGPGRAPLSHLAEAPGRLLCGDCPDCLGQSGHACGMHTLTP